ncbi:MAG TPA: alpha/beta hydrolase-fold protein [Acidobacteriota bacterium]|nr:alpha/beta hydrolase-fold protein [Acidobacteriota bacterium]
MRYHATRLLTILAVTLATCSLHIRAGQESAAPSGPTVKMLSTPLPEMQPPIDFLAREPVIDGRLDDDLRVLPSRPFAALVKMNPATTDTQGDYRLAYGSDFFYVFIDVAADSLVCRDRGYQNGDGFILILNRPRPENTPADESYMLAYNPTSDPKQPFAQMVWKRNDAWPFSPLSEGSAFKVSAAGGRLGFEALLRWTDVHPYHPWLAESIGFNLIVSKAYGDRDVNYLAAHIKPAPGMEAFTSYSRLDFAAPSVPAGAQSTVVLSSGHITAGDPLRLRLLAAADRPVREEVAFRLHSGEGARVLSQTIGVDLTPGVTVQEAVLDTTDLPSGGYTVRWESRSGSATGQVGLTVLPPFASARLERTLDAAGAHLTPGSRTTIRFLLAEIAAERARLKSYDPCPELRARMERTDRLIREAAGGDDLLARRRGLLRRAFESQVDRTLQPYTAFVPTALDAGKTYPAIVFLHGSDSDDQSVRRTIRAFPALFPDEVFVIAPYGRGRSNSYTRDHAQDDIREAVADALREYPIDPARLVLAGFSMGGYGVYRTLYENPGRYAAAAVFSGIPYPKGTFAPGEEPPDFRQPECLKTLSGMNIAVIHGGRDRNCPVELTTDLVARMKGIGIPVLFLLDEQAGHEPPRDPAIVEAYRRWLDEAIRKRQSEGIEGKGE